MTKLPEFVPFPKIPRLYKECVITEKIDGTNGVIYITDVEVGDNLKMNPFKVALHLQELYDRIEQLEKKVND